MFSTEDFLARRNLERAIINEGTAVWKQKKEMDAARELEDQKQLRMMLKSYNPWGKPGNGAPVPGAIRKSKLILDAPMPQSVLTMGRPGHGAPLRTSSGRTKTAVHCDPSIRFQFQETTRRSVDNQLRYRTSAEEKENYRKQLDALILQKAQLRKTLVQPAVSLERSKQRAHGQWACAPPWGRAGPGGRAWRDPRLLGHNFLKSLGYSNEVTLRRLPQQEAEQVFEISGGVELVPLLAKHRVSPRRPLPTTDVTRISKIPNGPPKVFNSEAIYQHELANQVTQRYNKIQEQRQQEMESSQKHFDTWKGLWGRPGHGAPKGCNLAKEKLDVLLYHLPARTLSAA